jgi:hypothetical protein
MGTPVWRGLRGRTARGKKKEDYKTRWVQLLAVPTGLLGTARPTPATPNQTGDFNEGIRRELSYTVTRVLHKIARH